MKINNRFYLLTGFTFLFCSDMFPQGMGISEVSITPEAKSILELRSTERGFLVPRMTTAERDLVSLTPPTPTSLMIFNNSIGAYQYWDGSAWVSLLESSGALWSKSSPDVFLTTSTDEVGIGTSTPNAKLDIVSTSTSYPWAVQVDNSATSSPTNNVSAFFGTASGAQGVGTSKYGGFFQSGNGAGTNYGIWSEALLGTGTNIGGYFNAIGGALNYAIVVPPSGGNVGIGTVIPSRDLSFGGEVARTIWMERNTGAVTPAFRIQAAGATVGATNRQGGVLQLSSGISTGNVGSNINFFTATPGAGGTSDNNPTQKMVLTADGALGIGSVAAFTSSERLVIQDGLLRISQTTAPTITVLANAGSGATGSVTAGSTDNAGQFTLNSSMTGDAIGNVCIINFNKSFLSGIIVVITPANAAASTKEVYCSTTTTTSFTVGYNVIPATATCIFNYLVIGN